MAESIDPNDKTGADIRRMFDEIAPRYDRANHLLSVGLDRGWRRRAVQAALSGFGEYSRVLDVCCGTGDLALALAADGRSGQVVGVDFATAMLGKAVEKTPCNGACRPVRWLAGDALALPFADGSFDVVTVAFGLRNLADPASGIRECSRLLKPGGRLIVLEFFEPRAGVLAGAFRWYFHRVLPHVGRWIAGGGNIDAYRYLPESVAAFASADEVQSWFEDAGFHSISRETMSLGAATMLQGDRPEVRARNAEGPSAQRRVASAF